MTLQDKHTKIVAATEADTEEILRLYKAQLGQEFCPWDEHYPERENIAFDLERDALFVMKNEKDEIIAAISDTRCGSSSLPICVTVRSASSSL